MKPNHEEYAPTLPNLTAVAAAGGWKVKEFGLRLGNVRNPRTLNEIVRKVRTVLARIQKDL